jgi:hypothetical protein
MNTVNTSPWVNLNPDAVYPATTPFAPVMRPPNECDLLLRKEGALWSMIQAQGGLQKICCPQTPSYDKPPYLIMPPQGRQYQEINSIPLPPNNGLDVLVTEFFVPTGYDGVITSVTNFYTGAGFVEGSGDLTWRIQVGLRWARNFGNIETTLGSLASPCPLFRGGLRLTAEQRVRYFVNHAAGSGLAGGRVICAFFGWFYPAV